MTCLAQGPHDAVVGLVIKPAWGERKANR